jgi:hypothetical protein
VERLARAADRLETVAATIKSSSLKHGPALVQLLIDAQEPIVDLVQRGGASMVRHLEREGAAQPAERTAEDYERLEEAVRLEMVIEEKEAK